MKIEHDTNNFTIMYDEEESNFIETLEPKLQRYIRMGLLTVYDCGYKSESK